MNIKIVKEEQKRTKMNAKTVTDTDGEDPRADRPDIAKAKGSKE